MKIIKLVAFLTILTSFQFNVSAQDKKIALTTFYVSKHIGFDELGGNAAMVASIASLSEDPNFNLKPVLDNFYKTFTEVYVPQFPFLLLPNADVTGKKAYIDFEGRFNEETDKDRGKFFQRFIVIEDFKPLQESLFNNEKSNQMQMVEMFKDQADGIMFVSMGYEFVKKAVPFTAGIRAYIKIKVWNKEGDKVFSIYESANSKKSVAIVGGIPIMSAEKLLPMCEDASAELVEDLGKKIGKMARKAAKKL
jgi:hypothetical protein